MGNRFPWLSVGSPIFYVDGDVFYIPSDLNDSVEMSSRSTRFMNEPLALERALQRIIIRLSTSCLIKSYEGTLILVTMNGVKWCETGRWRSVVIHLTYGRTSVGSGFAVDSSIAF